MPPLAHPQLWRFGHCRGGYVVRAILGLPEGLSVAASVPLRRRYASMTRALGSGASGSRGRSVIKKPGNSKAAAFPCSVSRKTPPLSVGSHPQIKPWAMTAATSEGVG